MINKYNSIKSIISISCAKEGEKTLLKDSLSDIPYKVVHYGSKLLSDHLEVMLMCSSPGVMDGDSLEVSVDCTDGSEMKLFTQAYNKLHPMKFGASQRMSIKVGNGSIFQFFPYPTIPFKDSIFDAFNEIHVAETGNLIWGDIISGGRIHSGERFEFTRLHIQTKIYHGKKLILYDNQFLDPQNQCLDDMLFFENHTHQATLIIVAPHAVALKKEMDELFSEQFSDLRYGITLCNDNAIMLRALGTSGDAMHGWIGNIADMCWSFIKYQKGNGEAIPTSNEYEGPNPDIAEDRV